MDENVTRDNVVETMTKPNKDGAQSGLLPEAMRRERLNDSLAQIDKIIERWNRGAMRERWDAAESHKVFKAKLTSAKGARESDL